MLSPPPRNVNRTQARRRASVSNFADITDNDLVSILLPISPSTVMAKRCKHQPPICAAALTLLTGYIDNVNDSPQPFTIADYCQGQSPGSNGAGVSIILAQADSIRECDHCRPILSAKFLIPNSWWTDFVRNSNGYFGYQDILDDNGRRSGAISWVRFIAKRVGTESEGESKKIHYYWVKLNAFSKWDAATDHTDVILFDHEDFAEGVKNSILENISISSLRDPFWIYPPMTEIVAELQDRAVWETRNLVRDFEKERAFFQLDYPGLHEIPRHLIHVHETVYVAEVTLQSISTHHEHFINTRKLNVGRRVTVVDGSSASSTSDPKLSPNLTDASKLSSTSNSKPTSHLNDSTKLKTVDEPNISLTSDTNDSSKLPEESTDLIFLNIKNRLSFSHHMLTSLRHRSDSNKARIQNEMTLAYNDTARIDSSAVRTISFVGLTFLPATFMAAIFSTSFFNFDAPTGVWGMSDNFWIYWLVTVPLTIVTIVLWYYGPRLLAKVPPNWKKWLP